MEAEPQSKALYDEVVDLASSSQNSSTVARCCTSFVKLLDSIAGPLHTICFNEENGDGRGILFLAANLQQGFFRDLEILFVLFDLTLQIVSSLGKMVNLEGTSLDCCADSNLGSFCRRRFVSAFFLGNNSAVNHAEMSKTQLSRIQSSPCLPRWKLSRNAVPKPLRNPTQEAETKLAEETLKIGGENLNYLRLEIMELKDQFLKAGKILKEIFLSAEPQLPSFLVKAHMREVVRSFLTFESMSDPIHEYQVHLCPIGYGIYRSVVEKVVSEISDPMGPFVVGICGPVGIGKTSVAASVASDSEIKRHFVGGVFWITVDGRTDPMTLQCCLWRAICGSKTGFNSVEEGLVALKRKFTNCLPSLLIVDGLWEASQLEGLLCFDGKEYGRIIVTTSKPETLPSTYTQIHGLSSVKEKDALDLFLWGAGWNSTPTLEEIKMATKLVNKCQGSPLVIQAFSSTLYTGSTEEKKGLQILLNKDGACKEDQRITMDQRTKTNNPENDSMTFTKSTSKSNFETKTKSTNSMLLNCFGALGLIHPLLQECFLDLAAFPEGEWVSFSKLEKLWLAFSNGLNHEEIVVILSILVCRSMVDWRLNIHDACDLDIKIEFKLPGAFYNLATKIIQQDIECHTRKKDCHGHMTSSKVPDSGKEIEHRNVSLKYFGCMKRIFGFDIAYISCSQEDMDLKSCTLVTQTPEYDKALATNEFENIPDMATRGKDTSNMYRSCWGSRFYQEFRLFIPGCNITSYQIGLFDESSLRRATKISVYSSNVCDIPNSFRCPSLHVGLFGGNPQLSLLPSVVLRDTTQLQFLDLRGCVSLLYLPSAISALQSLQLLDLSFCTSLRSLPSSFVHLKRLKFLRLLGCTSLTHLPKATGSLRDLEVLQLNGCIKLKTLPSTIGQLSLLRILDLKGCFSLRCLPLSIGLLRQLSFMDLSECSNLSYTIPCYAQLLLMLIGIQKTRSMAVPTSLWNSSQLEVLRLASMKNLTFLPHSIGRMQNIRHLDLSSCRRLDFLPDEIGNLSMLEKLDLSHTAIRKLPDSVGKLGNLLCLCLQGCSRLLCIPSSISLLTKLRRLDTSECWDLVLLPKSMGNQNSLGELEELDLACCGFTSLPSFSWHALPKLKRLKLSGCYILTTLPPTMEFLTSLEKVDLEGCCALTSLKEIGLAKLDKLVWLSLRNCTSITTLPTEEILELKSLKYLDVSGCTGLSPFPKALLDHACQGNLTLIRWGAVWP